MLLGRDGERETLFAALDQARSGRGTALVVRGEPGIGKSALLADLVDGATGARVLRTQGIESEQPLPFAALHRLLQPLLREVDELPEPQAVALGRALGSLPDAGSGERFLAYLAALSLIGGTSNTAGPDSVTLCVIDDAHWLDDASLAALLFVARRIPFSPVAMIFAARDGEVGRVDAPDLPELRLTGVPAESARELIRRGGAVTDPSVLDVLVERAAGNPLALLELPRGLTSDEASGRVELPTSLPLTDELERVFLAQVDALSQEAQCALVVAAADDTEDASVVMSAVASLGIPVEALDETARNGLVDLRERALVFRHPLVRSAVYSAASPRERRLAHAALAVALDERGDRDRASWHLAAAAEGPDEQIAERLGETGERLSLRGGHEAATSALERAAELSTDGAAREQRLVAAAQAAWLAGDPVRTRRLAQRARASADPTTERELDRLRAFVEMNFGSPRLAHGILAASAQDAERAGDEVGALHYAMVAAALSAFGEDSGTELRVGSIRSTDPVDRCFAALLAGLDHLGHERLDDAAPLLREALRIGETIQGPDLLTNLGIAALLLGDDELALRWHDRQLDVARSEAAVLGVLHALTRRAIVQLSVGRWDDLEASNSEVLDLARATGHLNQRALPLAQSLVVDAYRGRADVVERADVIAVETRVHPSGILERLTLDTLSWARGIATAQDAPEAASRYLAAIRLPLMRRSAAMDAVEVSTRLGDHDAVRAIAHDLERFGSATGDSWARAGAEHCVALIAEEAEREAHFLEALGAHRDSLRVMGHARTKLAFGEYLRRARRRVDAREHLRTAAALFEDIGATPWATRALDELRASGETVRSRSVDATKPSALTAQERQVALLVQEGLSNKDVAARLFLSPRTVEFHLRNIFGKLGITSRAALARTELGTTD